MQSIQSYNTKWRVTKGRTLIVKAPCNNMCEQLGWKMNETRLQAKNGLKC